MVQNNSEIAQLKKQIEAQQAIIESLKAELNGKMSKLRFSKKRFLERKLNVPSLAINLN